MDTDTPYSTSFVIFLQQTPNHGNITRQSDDIVSSFLPLDDPGFRAWAQTTGTELPDNQAEISSHLASFSKNTVARLLVFRNHGDFVGGMHVFEKYTLGVRRWVLPPLTPYTPVFFSPDLTPGETGRLIASIKNLAPAMRLVLSPAIDCVDGFSNSGWEIADRQTIIGPLQNRDELVSSWSRKRRHAFRQAANRFQITENVSPADVIKLLTHSYQRHGRVLPVDGDRLHVVLGSLLKTGSLQAFGASAKDLHAAIVIIKGNKRVYYWLAGSDQPGAQLFLTAESIGRLKSAGYESIDFVGANHPGIAAFKLRFGGTLTPHYSVAHWHAGVSGLLHRVGILK